MRTQKKVGSKVTDYYYDSNNNLIAEKTDSATLFFYYNTENSPVALSYNGKMFYYVKNIQGDIVKILDEDGNEKASYVYNTWGDILSQSEDELSSINPLRYHGYVYDEDTTLYYLQTRYYDPTTGRFINADDTNMLMLAPFSVSVLDTNLMTYSRNNPINIFDPTGYSSRWVHLAKAIYKIGKGLAAIVSAIAKGFVRSALGSFTAWALGLIIGKAIFYFSFGQWWGVVINVAIIVTLALRVKSILFDLPSGLWHLKQFFHHTHK